MAAGGICRACRQVRAPCWPHAPTGDDRRTRRWCTPQHAPLKAFRIRSGERPAPRAARHRYRGRGQPLPRGGRWRRNPTAHLHRAMDRPCPMTRLRSRGAGNLQAICPPAYVSLRSAARLASRAQAHWIKSFCLYAPPLLRREAERGPPAAGIWLCYGRSGEIPGRLAKRRHLVHAHSQRTARTR